MNLDQLGFTFVLAKGLRLAAALQWLLLIYWTLKLAPRSFDVKTFAVFAASVVIYLLSPYPFYFDGPEVLRNLAIFLGWTPIFFLWLVTKSTFDRKFRPSWPHLMALVVFEFSIFLTHSNATTSRPFYSFFSDTPLVAKWLEVFLPQLFVIPFVVGTIRSIQSGRQDDLIETRLAHRMRFIKLAILLYCFVSALEIVSAAFPVSRQILDAICASGVFAFGYLLDHLLKQSGFAVFKDPPLVVIQETVVETASALVPAEEARFKTLIEVDRFFLKPSIGLRELSEELKVPEYKLRRHINGRLGFQNFSHFLNHYRVNEACRIFESSSTSHIPIYNLAIDLGYGSAVSFNRAFKEVKGVAPSIYRDTIRNNVERADSLQR